MSASSRARSSSRPSASQAIGERLARHRRRTARSAASGCAATCSSCFARQSCESCVAFSGPEGLAARGDRVHVVRACRTHRRPSPRPPWPKYRIPACPTATRSSTGASAGTSPSATTWRSVLRQVGRRPRALRALLGGRVGRHRGVFVLGHPAGGEPPVERARRARREARRPGRDHPAAAARDRDRLRRRVPDGRDRAAALASVRSRRARVPHGARRSLGRDRRADHHRQPAGNPGSPDALAACDRRRRPRRRYPRVERSARKGERALHAGGYQGRRPGADHIYKRHYRAAEGRAQGAPRADRERARLCALARLLSRSPATCSGRPPTGRGPAA